jgi:hypothetical protein
MGHGSERHGSQLRAVWGKGGMCIKTLLSEALSDCYGERGEGGLPSVNERKKRVSRSNSFFQIFIFWGFEKDFENSYFFSGGSIPHHFFSLHFSLQDSKQ